MVDLYSFYTVEPVLMSLPSSNVSAASFTDLLHGVRDDVANGLVVVGGDTADLTDHVAGDWLGELVEFPVLALASLRINVAANRVHSFLNPALHGHGISAGCNSFDAFTIDGL